MPTKSPEQERLMQAAAHTPNGYNGVPKSVGKKFINDDEIKKLNELDVAKAIASGDLESPQFYGNMALFALRITGTGVAFRHEKKDDSGKTIQESEYCYRNPNDYLTDDFMERCGGLPVVWHHPESQILDSEEYAKRSIGSIMFAYPIESEVWGIARIYDETAIREMNGKKLSTSPGVILEKSNIQILEDSDNIIQKGEKILVEGSPAMLDHLAICMHGVWDKEGEPLGVSTQTTARADSMADETPQNNEDKPDLLQAIHDSITKLHGKYDDLAERIGKVEAGEKKQAEGHEAAKDHIGDPELGKNPVAAVKDNAADMERNKSQADDAKKDDDDDDGAKKDDDDNDDDAKKDNEPDFKAMVDSAVSVIDKKYQNKIKELESMIPKHMDNAELNKLSAAKARADSVYMLRGDSAPQPLVNEDSLNYRKRVGNHLKQFSKKWAGFDLSKADSNLLDIAELDIYADASNIRDIEVPNGELRRINKRTEAGHQIVEFVGSPKAWMETKAPIIQFGGDKR